MTRSGIIVAALLALATACGDGGEQKRENGVGGSGGEPGVGGSGGSAGGSGGFAGAGGSGGGGGAGGNGGGNCDGAAELLPSADFACGETSDGSALPACSTAGGLCCTQSDGSLTALGLGTVRVGTSSSLPLTIANAGCADLVVTAVTLEDVHNTCGAGAASISGIGAHTVLSAGDAHAFSIDFSSGTLCTYLGRLVVETNDPARPSSAFTVAANAVPTRLVSDQSLLQFGDVAEGSNRELSLVARNNGEIPIVLRGIEVTGNADFALRSVEAVDCASGTRTPVTIGSGYTVEPTDSVPACGADELVVTVRYAPSSRGERDTAQLDFTIDGGSPLTVHLDGASPSEP